MTLKLISVEVRNNKTRIFESMLMSFHQELRPECKNESLRTNRKQKEVDCFHVNEYCNHCKTVFEALGCYYHFCFCQETCPFLSKKDTERGNEKQEMDELRQEYLKVKGYNIQKTCIMSGGSNLQRIR